MKESALLPFAKSKPKAKAEARRLEQSQLEKLIASLNEALADVKKKASAKERADKAAKLKQIQNLIAKSGLTGADLKALGGTAKPGRKTAAKSAKKRVAVAPKYKLVVGGKEYLWTGRGRSPKVYAEYVKGGGDLKALLIK
jgi:DNA-binding protein H-NS